MKTIRILAQFVCSFALGSTVTWALEIDREASRHLASQVPIADVHMHLYKGLSPTDLLGAMDRNRIRWGGGVGPVGPGYDPLEFKKLLGARYFAAGAQAEQYEMFQLGGERELLTTESERFKALVQKLTVQFENKEIAGIGELILNNSTSSFVPSFRRKVRINGDSTLALFGLAQKYRGYVQIHAEDDEDSVSELESIVSRFPEVPVILAHCMSRATAQAVQKLLAKNSNLYCETSHRSTARNGSPFLQRYMIHGPTSADQAWLSLMEAMPDRFMVGTDIYSKDVAYDHVVQAIRTGLLANLSVTTLKKVAYENAQRVFRLEPGGDLLAGTD